MNRKVLPKRKAEREERNRKSQSQLRKLRNRSAKDGTCYNKNHEYRSGTESNCGKLSKRAELVVKLWNMLKIRKE